MNTLETLQEEIHGVGYARDAVFSNYGFADVLADVPGDRTIDLAAFSQTPPSYRTAALGAVRIMEIDPEHVVSQYRSLGAPILFAIGQRDVSVWQVRSDGAPRRLTSAKLDQLPALFKAHAQQWNPRSIQSAKTFGQVSGSYQLDFVDIGLLPAIEGHVHEKLDRLLREVIANAAQTATDNDIALDERDLYRVVFRLLAAKVLQDRKHHVANAWDPNDTGSVISGIAAYYKLRPAPKTSLRNLSLAFSESWRRLRDGINFRNISADDLAFIYEETLVTPSTRSLWGTHSTPRQVAEYVVNALALWKRDIERLSIYEPFVGAGVFLVAALRALKDSLPQGMPADQRHAFLVHRLSGDDADSFAVEVATLSLILADYPSLNGWDLRKVDLFESTVLRERARPPAIVLCNPPFERFTREEQARYPEAFARSPISKAGSTLDSVLDAEPIAFGFVMPHPFLRGPEYLRLRQKVESKYSEVQLVDLPDNIFRASSVRSCLVMASSPRRIAKVQTTKCEAIVVSQTERERFLRTGQPSTRRTIVRLYSERDAGALWVPTLASAWSYLASYPRLGGLVAPHRGLRWHEAQSAAVSENPRPGFRKGLFSARQIRQFVPATTAWLDFRPSKVRWARDLPWDGPKLIGNAARISRGPWCFAAIIDHGGLLCSQQLAVILPKEGVDLRLIAAILNGPVANAYLADNSEPDRIRQATLTDIPIPPRLPHEVIEDVDNYLAHVKRGHSEEAYRLLLQIDAKVLRAYDLPPRIEREVLELFRDEPRPVGHHWADWFPRDFSPLVPLHEYLSTEYARVTRPWVHDVFKPLPPDEAKALREYLE